MNPPSKAFAAGRLTARLTVLGLLALSLLCVTVCSLSCATIPFFWMYP